MQFAGLESRHCEAVSSI